MRKNTTYQRASVEDRRMNLAGAQTNSGLTLDHGGMMDDHTRMESGLSQLLHNWIKRYVSPEWLKGLEMIGIGFASDARPADHVNVLQLFAQRVEVLGSRNSATFRFHTDVKTLSVPWEKAKVLLTVLQDLTEFSLMEMNATDINIVISKNDKHIIVAFSDDGKGFDASRIFRDPPPGLKRFKRSVAELDGRIQVSSIKQVGSQFTLYFKRIDLLS